MNWDKIETDWLMPYSSIKLLVDGFELTLVCQKITQNKLGMVVFVNGELSGRHLFPVGNPIAHSEPEWTEIGRRFYQTKTKSVFSAKEKQKYKKLFAGRKSKERLEVKQYSKSFYWSSFVAFRRHIEKHNVSIELKE